MKKEVAGVLGTSFILIGSLHFSLRDSNFPTREINEFLEGAKGRRILLTIDVPEEVLG